MLKIMRLGVTALAALATLSGCAGRGGPVPYDVPNFTAPDTDRAALGSNGTIGPLDTLGVVVYQLPELTRELVVDSGGNVSLPLVGSVHAEGLTPAQLELQIAGRLATRYVRSPSVQVTIKKTIPRTITVEGSVKKPGIFEVQGQTTLLGAMALASGPDEHANVHRVVVFRRINGQRQAAAFDLGPIRRGQREDPVIYGNDTVVLDGSRLSQAYRELLEAVPLLYLFRAF